jgi:ribosomal protein L44E
VTQHFTRSTVSAAFYCPKCGKSTQHRIDDRRKGPCLECIAKFDAAKNASRETLEPTEQQDLFGEKVTE